MWEFLEFFSAQATEHTARLLADAIKSKEAPAPLCIIAPVRGGLIPGVMLSHLLGVPLFPVSYSLRDHKANEDIPDSVFEYVTRSTNKRVILIDDIVDAGLTMQGLVSKLKDRIDGIEIETAALIYNVAQDFKPDYYGWTIDRTFEHEFITFFWELN